MAKANTKSWGGKRQGSGRPASGSDPVRAVRLSDALIAEVDRWALKELGSGTPRSEAIRELIEAGLHSKRKAKRKAATPPPDPPFLRSTEFLRMAEQFYRGYVLIPDAFPLDYAKYFLFCHSIEVALKAYLVHIGYGEEHLRIEFGHDLARLLREAQSRDLGIADDHVWRLSNLAEPHLNFWARYPRADWSSGGIAVVKQYEPQVLDLLDAVSQAIYGAPIIRSWIMRQTG
jgi:hypothetical protein